MAGKKKGVANDAPSGSAGMFVQSVEFIRVRAKARGDISICVQESVEITWRTARLYLAIDGMDSGQIAQGDTFHNDRYPELKSDCILSDLPTSFSGRGGEPICDEKRRQCRPHAEGNANIAPLQRCR